MTEESGQIMSLSCGVRKKRREKQVLGISLMRPYLGKTVQCVVLVKVGFFLNSKTVNLFFILQKLCILCYIIFTA